MFEALFFVLGLALGWFSCAYVLVVKKKMIELKENQVVVVKPDPGLTMVALPPELLRKVVISKYNYDEGEARAMLEKYASSQSQKNIETK